MKVPINLKDVAVVDLLPAEIRFRGRVVAAEMRPKGAQFNDEGQVVGPDGSVVTKDDGSPQYGLLNVGLAFVEHQSNYVPMPPSGEAKPLVGRRHYEGFTLHPNGPGRRLIAQLFDNTGTDREADANELEGKEVDFVLQHKPRKDDPETKEARIKRFTTPVG